MRTIGFSVVFVIFCVSATVAKPKQNHEYRVGFARAKRSCVCPQMQSSCACSVQMQLFCSCPQYENSCQCPQETETQSTVTHTELPAVLSSIAPATYPLPSAGIQPNVATSSCCYPYSGTVKLCFNVEFCSNGMQQSSSQQTHSDRHQIDQVSPVQQLPSQSNHLYQYQSQPIPTYQYPPQPSVYQHESQAPSAYPPELQVPLAYEHESQVPSTREHELQMLPTYQQLFQSEKMLDRRSAFVPMATSCSNGNQQCKQ